MSYASTISHYIKIASQGRQLDRDNICELEDAINGLVEEAVGRAVRLVADAHREVNGEGDRNG
jgi:hypothetical protein